MNTENQNPTHTLSKHTSRAETIALARYAAVSWAQTQLAGGLTLQQALRGAVERRWNEHRFALSSLERYYYAWRRGGFDALHPKGRSDRGRTTALSVEVQQRLMQLRREHPQLTVSVLIKQLLQEGLLQPGQFSLPSIYRYLARIGLDARTVRACGPMLPGGGPTKAFETALANELWMTDLMYGPSLRSPDDGRVIHTRLFALLDDCSRLCPHAQYYGTESTECFLDVLREGVQRRGLPERLYSDHGRVFTCRHLQVVCANLGIRLIHAKPYAAWSKGKIERFFRTVQQDFQQTLSLQPVHSLAALNERFWKWLESDYHQRVHQGIEESPCARFARCSGAIRPAPPAEAIQRLFLDQVARRVRKDATFSLHGRWFEVAPLLRGQKIQIAYDPFGWTLIEVWWQGKFIGTAKPLDKHINAKTFARSNDYANNDPVEF
jgi:transposase InsO family protein